VHDFGEYIAGVDEAGRGALAGPVVAGACLIPCPLFRRRRSVPRWSPYQRIPKDRDCLIADSKQLSPEERDVAFSWITIHCPFGVGVVPASFIEEHGILAANNRAMQIAVEELQKKQLITRLLIDGRDHFQFSLPHQSIIRGDSIEPSIAAASIVAKVTRDRIMIDLNNLYPSYGFEKHKGYGSADHIENIRVHGPCAIHRLSFLGRILQTALC